VAVTLGRAGAVPTGLSSCTGIINVTWTESIETIDVTHRGVSTSPAYRQATGGFVTRSPEVECLDATAVMTALHQAGSGYTVVSVTENQPLDGPVTFTVTARAT
jgi:hypothetical protein